MEEEEEEEEDKREIGGDPSVERNATIYLNQSFMNLSADSGVSATNL